MGMGITEKTPAVTPELQAAAERALALPSGDQHRLLELLRERLSGEVAETKADRKASARTEALAAIGKVAAALGKPDEMPTADQFDGIAPNVVSAPTR
jgi:hypothetical protein